MTTRMTRSTTTHPSGAATTATRSLRQTLKDAGPSFVGLGFLGRLAPAMWPMGLTLYGVHQLDSFTAAGSIVAALALGNAIGGPLVGIAADRWGQRITGLVATVVATIALGLLVVWLTPGTSLSVLVGLAVVAGMGNPQVGAMARGRWAAAARQRPDRQHMTNQVFAYEGAIDEVAFVVGPVLVGLLAAVAPLAGLATALVVGLVLPVAYALHSSALPRGSERAPDESGPTSVRWARLVPIGGVCLAIGIIFGSVSSGITGFLTARGQEAFVGLVYGGLGVGSAVAGLVATRLHLSPQRRLLLFTATLVAVSPLLSIAPSAALLAVACFLCGCGVAPALIAAFGIGESLVPLSRISVVMTALGTCLTVGVATGSAVGGTIVDRAGPHWALTVAVGASVLALASAVVNAVTSRARTWRVGSQQPHS